MPGGRPLGGRHGKDFCPSKNNAPSTHTSSSCTSSAALQLLAQHTKPSNGARMACMLWAAAAANHGDASSDATVHPDNARAQEAAPAPEAAIPKWKAISMGFGIATEISGGVKQLKQDQADFLANVTAVGGEFLTELVAELNESVATAQSEILAANVPLASYGRVKDALDRVRGAPTRHASEHNALLPFAHILCPCPCPCAWPRRSCSSLTHACEVCSLKALLVIGLASCWAYPCRRFEQMCLKD